MAWTTPVSPTAGTAITVAWATANVVNPLIWLRNLTGGVDPPGSGYVARSSSTTNSNWFDLTGAINTINSSISAVAAVPSGLGGFFATAGGIAAGWSRYTNGDGRMLVGAGTTFSQPFTENTAVGSNWTPFTGISGFTGTAADVVNVTPSGSTTVSASGHQNSLSISAQTWAPVARVVVWATKN